MKIKEFTRIPSLTVVFTLPAGCGRDKDIPQEHAAEDEWEDEYGDATMRFTGEIFGDEDNSGIPMYIFLISIFSRYKRQQKLPEISTINSFA